MARGEQYNGWANYSTWRINLKIFDGQSLEDVTGSWDRVDAYDLGKVLEEQVESLLEESGKGLVLDYAMSFINDVDWTEIAEHLLDDDRVEGEEEE